MKEQRRRRSKKQRMQWKIAENSIRQRKRRKRNEKM